MNDTPNVVFRQQMYFAPRGAKPAFKCTCNTAYSLGESCMPLSREEEHRRTISAKMFHFPSRTIKRGSVWRLCRRGRRPGFGWITAFIINGVVAGCSLGILRTTCKKVTSTSTGMWPRFFRTNLWAILRALTMLYITIWQVLIWCNKYSYYIFLLLSGKEYTISSAATNSQYFPYLCTYTKFKYKKVVTQYSK